MTAFASSTKGVDFCAHLVEQVNFFFNRGRFRFFSVPGCSVSQCHLTKELFLDYVIGQCPTGSGLGKKSGEDAEAQGPSGMHRCGGRRRSGSAREPKLVSLGLCGRDRPPGCLCF